MDNRDGAIPELLAGAVFDAVQIVTGPKVLWLALDRSQHVHWQERALHAAQEAQAGASTGVDQTRQIADRP